VKKEVEADQDFLRRWQEELESQLLTNPTETWSEAGAKAQHLIIVYARTTEAQDARRQKLIYRALCDLARMIDKESERT